MLSALVLVALGVAGCIQEGVGLGREQRGKFVFGTHCIASVCNQACLLRNGWRRGSAAVASFSGPNRQTPAKGIAQKEKFL